MSTVTILLHEFPFGPNSLWTTCFCSNELHLCIVTLGMHVCVYVWTSWWVQYSSVSVSVPITDVKQLPNTSHLEWMKRHIGGNESFCDALCPVSAIPYVHHKPLAKPHLSGCICQVAMWCLLSCVIIMCWVAGRRFQYRIVPLAILMCVYMYCIYYNVIYVYSSYVYIYTGGL